MRNLDKIILVLYYKNGNKEFFIFNNRKDYTSYVKQYLDDFSKNGLDYFELYFGYLAEKG